MEMARGNMLVSTAEREFSPTLVGLAGPAVDAARAAGVLVDAAPDIDHVMEQLLAAPRWSMLDDQRVHTA